MPAQLQRPDIGHDRPAVPRLNTVAECIHRAEAPRDDVEEMLIARLAQALVMQAWRAWKATPDDDSLAAADTIVARRAEHVVSLASARQQLGGDRRPLRLVAEPRSVAARDRALRSGLQHASIAEQRRRLVFLILRLVIHVRARAGAQCGAEKEYGRRAPHAVTSSTEAG